MEISVICALSVSMATPHIGPEHVLLAADRETSHSELLLGVVLETIWDFPGGTVDVPCQCRGHRFNPWPGEMLYAVEQLSPCAAATEPADPRACAPQQGKPPQ